MRNGSTPSSVHGRAHLRLRIPNSPAALIPPLSQRHTRDSAQLVPKSVQKGNTASTVGVPEHPPKGIFWASLTAKSRQSWIAFPQCKSCPSRCSILFKNRLSPERLLPQDLPSRWCVSRLRGTELGTEDATADSGSCPAVAAAGHRGGNQSCSPPWEEHWGLIYSSDIF